MKKTASNKKKTVNKNQTPSTPDNIFEKIKRTEASRYPQQLKSNRFWWVAKKNTSERSEVLLDSQTQLLWYLRPENPEEKETHALLGRDFRTLTSPPEDWAKLGRKVEDTFIHIPAGWKLVSKERMLRVFNLGGSFGSEGLTSECGYSKASPAEISSNLYFNKEGAVHTRSFEKSYYYVHCSVLLEKNGVENLPISDDFEEYLPLKTDFSDIKPFSFSGWQLPSYNQIETFALQPNPYREGQDFEMQNWRYWRCLEGNLILKTNKKGKPEYTNEEAVNARELLVNTAWQALSPEQIILNLINQGWQLQSHDGSACIAPHSLIESLKEIDYRSVRLPKLEEAQFNDLNKGVWEFWGQDDALLTKEGVIARNPEKDVKTFNVAIDFGTSSTVVAMDNNGQSELLRIGVKDYYQPAEAKHFENPTVIEFVNYGGFHQAWSDKAYRPEVNWDDIRASHEAQHNFRNNQGDPKVVASIFPKMKQWALRQNSDHRVKIVDQQKKYELEIPPLKPTNPTKGQLLEVYDTYTFDPIEVYAWFLGMTINWRARGIFVKYYMTFPVDYPKEIKENILASFRRGLHRSMPEPFVKQEAFSKLFALKELATEPAAYAASALQELGVEPTEEGVAYSVFDFGGGTSDFDYGIYRWANAKEEDRGVERVLEHIGKQGDRFLGGENLLEHLAFSVFNQNIDICRDKRISFTCPLDATPKPGTELLIDKTKNAQTNSIMVMAKLRPYWEQDDYKDSSEGVEKIELLNREGQMQSCEFKIDTAQLDAFLTERIQKGIRSFFIGIHHTFAENLPKKLHVFLAGNSSRSKWVTDYFAGDACKEALDDLFGQEIDFTFHQPLEVDENDLYRPTAKTGVALGLLELCRGDLILVDKVNQASDQAAFNHFVGRLKRGTFKHVLKRNDSYQEWHELSAINEEGAVYLYHTQSLNALGGQMLRTDGELNQVRIDFAGTETGDKAYIRAMNPNTIEVCSAVNRDDLEKGDLKNQQIFKL